ncbi:MAG: glycosyltransferase family 2 protein [Woeseiaceae bacterium]|nr:glycosyltransferase family 2 protein [Woeseiaceae bacterium]
MDLTIVVPLYNEEESVALLYEAIRDALEGLELESEFIFVNDGSSDRTFEVAAELAARDSRLRIVDFRRNYGQTPAMAAGIDLAVGSVIVTMDGDLQNDPRDIPFFLEKMEEGYDIVVGWRHRRQDKFLTRKVPSVIANWLIGKVTGVPIRDNGCSLKAYKRDVIKSVPLYSEMHRFIPAMASLSGATVAEIKVRHHARRFGESKYGLSRIYKVLMDLMTIKAIVSFGARPIRWFGVMALLPALFSVWCLLYAFWSVLRGGEIPLSIAGTGVLLATMTFLLILTGALCELIYRTGDVDLARLAQIASMKSRPQGRTKSAV